MQATHPDVEVAIKKNPHWKVTKYLYLYLFFYVYVSMCLCMCRDIDKQRKISFPSLIPFLSLPLSQVASKVGVLATEEALSFILNNLI